MKKLDCALIALLIATLYCSSLLAAYWYGAKEYWTGYKAAADLYEKRLRDMGYYVKE